MRLTASFKFLLTQHPYIVATAVAATLAAFTLQRASLATHTPVMTRPTTREQWKKAIDDLPSSSKIPAFYFAHGQPLLVWPASAGPPMLKVDIQSPNGPLVQFLKDFGPALLSKYDPKAIVVFSAHWETSGEALGACWQDW